MLLGGLGRFRQKHRQIGIAARLEDAAEQTRDAWRRLAEHGWLALAMPEQHGGYGARIGDLAMLMHAAGEGGWRVPLIECLGEAAGALLAAPAGVHRNRLLSEIVAGTSIVGLVGGPDEPGRPAFTATPVGDRYRVAGSSRAIASGGAWTHLLVVAQRSGTADFDLYALENSACDVRMRLYQNLDGGHAADVEIVGTGADFIAAGTQSVKAAHQRGQLLAAAEVLGIARAAFDATREYLGQRRQFGQPLLSFQALRHRLVDLYLRIRELTALSDAAQTAYDELRPDTERLLLKLRAHASRTGRVVAQQSIQLHGGMGLSAEVGVGDYYKRVMQIDHAYGCYDDAIDRLAQTLELHPQTP